MILNRIEKDSCGLYIHVTWILCFQMFLCKHLFLDCIALKIACHRPQTDHVWRGGNEILRIS